MSLEAVDVITLLERQASNSDTLDATSDLAASCLCRPVRSASNASAAEEKKAAESSRDANNRALHFRNGSTSNLMASKQPRTDSRNCSHSSDPIRPTLAEYLAAFSSNFLALKVDAQ